MRRQLSSDKMERYRSGHNEAVLKTVCPKGRVGSNPTLSAENWLIREIGQFLFWKQVLCSRKMLKRMQNSCKHGENEKKLKKVLDKRTCFVYIK